MAPPSKYGSLWTHFERSRLPGESNPTCVCIYCGKRLTTTSAERAFLHLKKKCPLLPAAVYRQYRGVEPPSGGQRQLPEMIATRATEQEELTTLLAEAIYSSGVPFSFVRKRARFF